MEVLALVSNLPVPILRGDNLMAAFEYETFNLASVRERATQAIAGVIDEPFHCSDDDMEKVLALVNVLQDFNTLTHGGPE